MIMPPLIKENGHPVPAPLKPEGLNDYHIVNHFCSRPLFMQEYCGTINLKAVRKEYNQWILYAKGVSLPTSNVNTRLRSQPEVLLIRICDWAFAEFTASRVTVFAETYALAIKHLTALVAEFAIESDAQKPHFFLVRSEAGWLDTTPVTLPDMPIDTTNMSLHYGEDFPDWHEQFVKNLTHRNHGLAIFRGAPGTGKTTYLRKLMVTLRRSHCFLYMPMKIGWMLNAPETVQFWVEQRQRNPDRKLVIILEDAEHFLIERDTDNASSVSDLLNAGDGLLGDFLQLHLICTVNCDLRQLDKAAIRPGRLLAHREFKRLTPSQAQKLATAKHLQLEPQESYSLAEIYYGSNALEAEAAGRKVGFGG